MLVPSQGEMKALRPRHQGVGAFWGAGVGRGGVTERRESEDEEAVEGGEEGKGWKGRWRRKKH